MAMGVIHGQGWWEESARARSGGRGWGGKAAAISQRACFHLQRAFLSVSHLFNKQVPRAHSVPGYKGAN